MPESTQSLKMKARELNKSGSFYEALPLLEIIWEQEKSGWTGLALAQCYRRLRKFDEARSTHDSVNKLFPNFRPMVQENFWLIYSEKIKDLKNPRVIEDAQGIIDQIDIQDKYASELYNKVILAAVRFLFKAGDLSLSLKWLSKLDNRKLGGKPYTLGGLIFESDQKKYFLGYGYALSKLKLHTTYLGEYFGALGFEESKLLEFRNYLVSEITYQHYSNGETVNISRLAYYLRMLSEETFRRKSNSFELQISNRHSIPVSLLGDYVFCPVSFAIRETYKIENVEELWEKDEWSGRRKTLLDYYREFHRKEEVCLEMTGSELVHKIDSISYRDDLEQILRSNLVQSNSDESNPIAYFNHDGSICGNPQYIFENSMQEGQKRYVVIEKFTSWKGRVDERPFSNDVVRVLAYLFELQALQLDFACLIYWYWGYSKKTQDQKDIKRREIKEYRIFKFERTVEHKDFLARSIARLREFVKEKSQNVTPDKISSPRKCLHCSVMGYCNHKTGKFSKLVLPYNHSELEVGDVPKF